MSLFRLPTNSEDRCFTWLRLMGIHDVREKGLRYIYNNIKICNIHFEDYMFTSGRRQLLRDATPTIFLNCGFNAMNQLKKENVPESISSESKSDQAVTSLYVLAVNVDSDKENMPEPDTVLAIKAEII